MKASKQQLEQLVNEIGSALNLATSKDQAIELGDKKYLYLEYASVYGGYRVVMVNVIGGGHSGALGESSCCSRRRASEMYNFLSGVLTGIQSTYPND